MSKRKNYWNSGYWYCAATNDEYELTLFSGDNYEQLDAWVRAMGDCTSKKALRDAPNGIAVTDKKMFKVLRVNRASGHVLVGKMNKKRKKKK